MCTILIVDDEKPIRILLEQTLEPLEELGIRLLTAADGEEGLALIRKEAPQMVFLDIMLPGINGYEVCSTVKNTPGLKNTYIALLTAKGQESDKSRGTAAGADCYITKPFSPREIVDKALTILNKNNDCVRQ